MNYVTNFKARTLEGSSISSSNSNKNRHSRKNKRKITREEDAWTIDT